MLYKRQISCPAKSLKNKEFYFDLIQYWYKMTQYNSVDVKLLDSQLNKLKSATKN